jgi:hypothetical protein
MGCEEVGRKIKTGESSLRGRMQCGAKGFPRKLTGRRNLGKDEIARERERRNLKVFNWPSEWKRWNMIKCLDDWWPLL